MQERIKLFGSSSKENLEADVNKFLEATDGILKGINFTSVHNETNTSFKLIILTYIPREIPEEEK